MAKKGPRTPLGIIAAAALLALAIGCVSTKNTEGLLSAAGFKIVPAITPQQKTQLNTLPDHKISMTVRNGAEYFVFPDKPNGVLYVGQNAQYQQYQNLREQNKLAGEQPAEQPVNETIWVGWGMWGGPGWW